MSDLKEESFTIKIRMRDGKVDLWSKGMPDTRTFGGKLVSEVPWPHRIGLHVLGIAMRELELNGLELYEEPQPKGKES